MERRRETGTARAREEACEPSPEAKRAEERALEAECQRKVEGLPVSASVNFVPVLRLLDQGMTRADILAGIDAALGKGVVPRGWSVFENFIREAAKDRLERALPPRLRVVASGAGPPGERRVFQPACERLGRTRPRVRGARGGLPVNTLVKTRRRA